MRSKIHAPRLRALCQASAVVALAGLASACSNDASRIDSMLTSSVQLTDNQSAIIRQKSAATQAYPGDIQETTERSGIAVSSAAAAPLSAVSRAAPLAPAVNRSPLSAVSNSSGVPTSTSIGSLAVQQQYQVPQATPPRVQPPSTSGPIVLQPLPTNANPLKIVGVDDVVTGGVESGAKDVPVSAAHEVPVSAVQEVEKPAGWNSSKTTKVTIRPGETLHNLSRRYGVPVAAIMKTNNIDNADALTAGQTILIPGYDYAETAPVSAPDNDPVTRVSRSSRGFQGQARGRVAVPTPRVAGQVVSPATVAPVVSTQPASATSTYTVASGDTLLGIARKTGASAADIRSANNIEGDVVRLGQTLTIPGAGFDPETVGSVPPPEGQSPAGASVPVTAGTGSAVQIARRAQEEVVTPAKTSAAGFRWPTEGRVISNFGERQPGGANDGIDISVPVGTPVRATENGTVIYSGAELEDFGKLILVSHAGGWVSAYAHASAALVRRGDKVTRGQVIAKSGKSGNATVPKLHFELRKNSQPVNPITYLQR